jgi:hypothetical protein
MAMGDALEAIHEDEIDRGAAEGAQHPQRLAANRSEATKPNRAPHV